ncbi:glucose-specific PTS transporter subunit IIBC [Clostridium cellulovorans]|uniref:PTS system, glucose-specific IIBC subunit n=1 Tax=Clostridium cellulovorans (strain ATCC 35296 / DSM 3052 / OCM 3 / 743B) TaxID=573061 RepID=D9SS29_CLOC7|nr:glucose-specific PTS transporter subunit IIBC [Clostridium cellulovorans]ADL52476.1 PTS system, glucose-specific IIBC subunit [Clostridium cellulovorans 743B]
MGKKLFGVLQQVGKALMLPVALLPAAGMLLAFGTMFQQEYFLKYAPIFDVTWVQSIAKVMSSSGDVIFGNLPLLFAVGVAVGLAGGEGVAGLAAIVGFLIMNVTLGLAAGITSDIVSKNPAYALTLGIPTLQTGVFGGIIIGVVAAILYKRFFTIELPSYLGFFAGKRFVPIITAVTAIVVGLILTIIWPPIQIGLNSFSTFMLDKNRALAAFIFGVIERSLIPFGLHHIFYNPFWYQFGEYTNKAGQIVNGDQKIFFAQLKDNVDVFTAGTFMTGKFPFMMFGLPAAALAIYQESKPEKKQLVKGLMVSAALTSFLTGITEPLEFSFLFVAPILFAIHAGFAGLSFLLMHLFNIKIGMTFSGGVIDFILFGVIPNKTRWWLVIPIGLCFAVIYYFGFKFAIKKFNLKTPGREDEETAVRVTNASGSELVVGILEALGGKENLKDLDACITRLRVQVKDKGKVDKNRLKALGASGVLEVGNNIQAIFGPKSDTLKTQIQEYISSGSVSTTMKSNQSDVEPCEVISKEIDFVAPLSGTIVSLQDTKDPVFSEGLMGDGFAIEPSSNVVVSPVDGTLVTLFNTKHAIGITADTGHEILIHVGMDTVSLKGEGFTAFMEQGDRVTKGQKILEFDLEEMKKKVPSMITPIVFTNLKDDEKIIVKIGDKVKVNQKNIVEIE